MSDLARLCLLEHGVIRLQNGAPAAGAQAWVYARRKDHLVEAAVYADPEKTWRLPQPLTADAAGRLPGYVHPGRLEVRATWRGRSASTIDAAAAGLAARELEEAERAAQHARDAAEAAAAARKERIAGIVERADAAARSQAAQAAQEAEAARREERLRQYARERELAASEARRDATAFSVGLSPTIPRRQPLMLVVPVDASGVALATVFTPDYEPGYDSNFSADVPNFSPGGFGIHASTGTAYYDTAGPTEGEGAVFGISAPYELILVTA